MRNQVKRFSLLIISALMILLITVCSIPTMPEKIQIKATPTFNIPAGATVFDLSEYFDIDEALLDSLRDAFGEDAVTGTTVGGTYTIDIRSNLFEIDVAEFFRTEVDLGNLNQTIDPISFTVPEIEIASLDAVFDLPSGPVPPGEIATVEDSLEIPLIFPEEFISAIIGEGKILIGISSPVGIEIVFTSIKLFQGVTELNFGEEADLETHPIDLNIAGVPLATGENLTLSWEYEVSAPGGAELAPGSEVVLSIEPEITEFSELVLNMPEALDFSVNEVFSVDKELREKVSTLTFSEAKIEFNFINNLPAPLTLGMVSEVLLGNGSGPPVERTFDPSAFLQTDDIPLLGTDPQEIIFPDPDVEEEWGIDIELTFTLGGYDPVLDELKLENVTPGTVYSFSGSVELILEIASVTVNELSMSSGFPDPDDIDGEPLDLSMLDEFLPKEVRLNGLEVSLAISAFDHFDGSVVLLARYTPPNGGGKIVKPLLPDGPAGPEGVTSFLPGDYAGELFSEADDGMLPIFGLPDILNDRPGDLELAFAVDITGGTIDVTGAENIFAALNIVLPLSLDVGAKTPGDLWLELPLEDEVGAPLLAIDEDLLDRGDDPYDPDIQDILNNLSRASLNFNLTNGVLVNESGSDELFRVVIFQPATNGGPDFEKEIVLKNGANVLELTKSDIDFIMNNLFMPEITVYLPVGVINFNYEGQLGLSLWMSITADIDHTFTL